MSTCFINGEFLPSKDAKISIFDRGLLFGDGVYEVIPVYHSRLCFLDRHLTRLNNSLDQCKIPRPAYQWEALCTQLIKENGGGDLQIYIQITRGNQGERKHDIPSDLSPTVIAFTLNTPYPILEAKHQGLKANLVDDYRWLRCDIKSTSLLGNILLNDEAVSQQSNTAILIRNGLLTEGSASNVFIIDKDQIVRTPALNNFCLPGITRQITLELLDELGVKVVENEISKNDLMQAREVWITSTTKEIYPVTSIDNQTIGTGKPGSIWTELNRRYQILVSE